MWLSGQVIMGQTHIPEVSPNVISSNDSGATGHGDVSSQDAEGGRLASTCKGQQTALRMCLLVPPSSSCYPQ